MKFLIFFFTLVLKAYFTSCDYSSDVENLRMALNIQNIKTYIRPSSTVNVSVGLNVVSLHLDSHRETLSVTGKLIVSWYEPNLGWTASNYNDIYTVLLKDGDIWKPELVIENMVDDIKVLHDETLFYRLYNIALVVMEIPISVIVHCSLDFTYYPFDKQTCGIILSSWSYDHSEMALYPLNEDVNLDMYQESSQFEVVKSSVESTQELEFFMLRRYSKLTFSITVRRHTQFYGLTITLPLVLLSLLTILIFLLPLESGEKASYSITLLLMVAIYYTVAVEYMPVFTGVSVLVGYISLVLLLATLATLCEILILYLYHKDHQCEMRPIMISVLHFLAKITCNLGSVEDTRSVVTSEGTSSTRVSDHDLQASSSIPNPGHEAKRPVGRLAPINRKIEPLLNTNTNSGKSDHRDSLPPLDPTPRSDTHNIVEQTAVTQLFSDRKPKMKEITYSKSPWHLMAKCLDTICFVIFLVISFITHFIFLVILGTGSL